MQIHPIDLKFRGLPNCILSFLLETSDGLTLIEPGPESTLETCLKGIRNLGFDPDEVKHVLVTHIHLDHAGAAGWWAGQGAQVYVHERGAKHLSDPTRLLDGARMVYGEALESLWGPVRPISPDQITALSGGQEIRIGNTEITAWDTPGHAFHHHAFVWDGVAFVGDVAGARLPGCAYISPTTAPSQFDPESYVASMHRLRNARLDQIFLTHSGAISEPEEHLVRYEEVIHGATELVKAHRRNGASSQEISDAFTAWNLARARREGLTSAQWDQLECANPSDMCASGVSLFWNRKEDEDSR